jgi:hypothetical protein
VERDLTRRAEEQRLRMQKVLIEMITLKEQSERSLPRPSLFPPSPLPRSSRVTPLFLPWPPLRPSLVPPSSLPRLPRSSRFSLGPPSSLPRLFFRLGIFFRRTTRNRNFLVSAIFFFGERSLVFLPSSSLVPPSSFPCPSLVPPSFLPRPSFPLLSPTFL